MYSIEITNGQTTTKNFKSLNDLKKFVSENKNFLSDKRFIIEKIK